MFGLYVLSVVLNILPLVVVLIITWESCTKTKREGVAITVTGVCWIFFLIVTMLGTVPKKINRVATFIIVYALLEVMKPLMNYMCIFAGAATLGALVDVIFVRPIIRKYHELRIATKTSDMTTMQVKEAIKEIIEKERSGRV
jgi:hypothetical protein